MRARFPGDAHTDESTPTGRPRESGGALSYASHLAFRGACFAAMAAVILALGAGLDAFTGSLGTTRAAFAQVGSGAKAKPVSSDSNAKVSKAAKAEKAADGADSADDAESEGDSGDDEPRKFNDVLTDLLNEFAYDLKSGLVQGVPNTALRRVALSEGIPKSYETYLESLVSERLRRFGGVKVIQCAQCKVKRSHVDKGRVVISSPVNNPAELDSIAAALRVETWTDVALLYQESSMLLAFNVFDAKTKELVWTKIYNSETLYRKVAKERARALDPSAAAAADAAAEEAKRAEDAKSRYAVAITVGYMMIPNVKKPSNMVGLILRGSEKFNQERSEIGASLMPVVDPGVFVSDYEGVEGDPGASGEVTVGGKTETIKPFRYGLGLFGTYHHNLISLPEDFDEARWGANLSLGGMLAKGYITFTGRAGPTLKLGRSFIAELGVMYSAPTTLTIKDTFTYKTKGGLGADVTFGLSF